MAAPRMATFRASSMIDIVAVEIQTIRLRLAPSECQICFSNVVSHIRD